MCKPRTRLWALIESRVVLQDRLIKGAFFQGFTIKANDSYYLFGVALPDGMSRQLTEIEKCFIAIFY